MKSQVAKRKLVCEWEVGRRNWAGCGDLASWAYMGLDWVYGLGWVYGISIGTGQGEWAGCMDQGLGIWAGCMD